MYPAFFIAPAMNPRTVCFCQPIFSMISANRGTALALEHRDHLGGLAALAGPRLGLRRFRDLWGFGRFLGQSWLLSRLDFAGRHVGPGCVNDSYGFGGRGRLLNRLGLQSGFADFCRQSGIVLGGCCGLIRRGFDGRFRGDFGRLFRRSSDRLFRWRYRRGRCGSFSQALDGFPDALNPALAIGKLLDRRSARQAVPDVNQAGDWPAISQLRKLGGVLEGLRVRYGFGLLERNCEE